MMLHQYTQALQGTTGIHEAGELHGSESLAAWAGFRLGSVRSGCGGVLGQGNPGGRNARRRGGRTPHPASQRRAHHLRRPALSRLRLHGPRAPPHAAPRPARAGESRLPVRPRAQQPLLPEPRLDHHRPATARAPDRRQRSARVSADSAHWPGRPGCLHRRPRSNEPAPRGMAAPAAAPGRPRLRKPADRQVVAGRLCPRRLHSRDVEGAAARRRGTHDRPAVAPAGLRLHRPLPRRWQALLRLVRPDATARSARSAAGVGGSLRGSHRQPPRGAVLGQRGAVRPHGRRPARPPRA